MNSQLNRIELVTRPVKQPEIPDPILQLSQQLEQQEQRPMASSVTAAMDPILQLSQQLVRSERQQAQEVEETSQQVWSLTRSYSAGFSQSRISVKKLVVY